MSSGGNNDPSRFGKLAGQEFLLTEENIQKIESHLLRFLDDDGLMAPENTMMMERLKSAFFDGRLISGADASFYFHELHEFSLMNSGMDYFEAHDLAIAEYEVSPFTAVVRKIGTLSVCSWRSQHGVKALATRCSIYAPEVIESFPEAFNSLWFTFWNLRR